MFTPEDSHAIAVGITNALAAITANLQQHGEIVGQKWSLFQQGVAYLQAHWGTIAAVTAAGLGWHRPTRNMIASTAARVATMFTSVGSQTVQKP